MNELTSWWFLVTFDISFLVYYAIVSYTTFTDTKPRYFHHSDVHSLSDYVDAIILASLYFTCTFTIYIFSLYGVFFDISGVNVLKFSGGIFIMGVICTCWSLVFRYRMILDQTQQDFLDALSNASGVPEEHNVGY